jgi:glycosyltransferase involved in cell wall biosynthesis
MQILMTFPFSLGISGGGTYAFLQTALHLKAAGASVTVMPLNSPGLKLFLRSPLPEEKDGRTQINTLREAGIEVIPVPTDRLSYVTDPVSMQKAVGNFAARQQVDALISWHHEGAFLGKTCQEENILFTCRAAGNYANLTTHRKGRLWGSLLFQLLRQAFSQSGIIWATSNFTREEVLTNFELESDSVTVIPEGMNPIFETAERQQRENEPIRRFIYFGVWSKSKGVFDALSAFRRLKKRGVENWEFQIAGWGNEEKILQFVQENGMMDQVRLLGKLDHPALIKALEWAQVAVLPSYIESFGLAVAEAQAGGLPVIAYDSGAVPEMVENGRTGWLVPLKQIDLLAEAILNSMKKPAKTYQMGLAGREKLAGRFTWSRTTQQMLNDIEKLQQL